MISAQVAGWGAVAVLVFWAVGAYNRLVGLRNDIARAFGPVDAQLRRRQLLLQQWIDAVQSVIGHDGSPLDAVTAAAGQLNAACDAARIRPSAARPIASLRVAEETLAEARQRLLARLPGIAERVGGSTLAQLADEMAAADSALGFACRQFNEATQSYNDAIDQFPTWVIAGVFRFRGAGTL